MSGGYITAPAAIQARATGFRSKVKQTLRVPSWTRAAAEAADSLQRAGTPRGGEAVLGGLPEDTQTPT